MIQDFAYSIGASFSLCCGQDLLHDLYNTCKVALKRSPKSTVHTHTSLSHNYQNKLILLYIPQEVVNEVQLTVLSHHQYCVVVNPLGDDGRPYMSWLQGKQ